MKHWIFLLTSCVLAAQTAPRLEFDVASVKPNHSGSGHAGVDRDRGLLRMENVTLKSCITLAYGVADAQVSGPDWLETERYDIVAKADDDTIKDQYLLRLQALLAERFKLTFHRETKELPAFELTVAKNGPKIHKDESDGKDHGTSSQRGHVTAKILTMPELARFLAGPRAALGRPVVDKTGLDGKYTFDLKWTPEGARPPEGTAPADAPPSLFVALQEQLGLKLEARKAPVEILVIDHAEKVPVEN